MGGSIHRFPLSFTGCELSVQKIINLFYRFKNNCIFLSNPLPACISEAYRETQDSQGF